ncbi:hypothetical protein BCS42_13200 [Crenothrix sp. D3]|jgi:hypothetical protein|nr:hypothetical protein BCS42_13200 [Crenothrix sp. D3]
MAIPTYKNWIERTKQDAFHRRSDVLRLLDEALEVYDKNKSKVNKSRLSDRLNDWIKAKGDGEEWKDSRRNKKDVVQELYDALSPVREDSLKAEYTQVIRPAYVNAGYDREGALPADLSVDQSLQIDGLGSPGFVQVSMGVVNEPRDWLRTFAVAHETGHAVAYLVCQDAGTTAPEILSYNVAKRHEHLADLIGMHVLMNVHQGADVINNLNILSAWLGYGDPQHPSGAQRAELIRRFYNDRVHFNNFIRNVADLHVNLGL